MRRQQHTAGLALVSLTLVLAACGGGTVDPPLPGTPVTSLADSGPGTLRELLGSAKAGDTLRLDSGTITLAGPLKLTKSVTLNLGSGVIDAAGKGRALEIPSGVTVTITGRHPERGHWRAHHGGKCQQTGPERWPPTAVCCSTRER